MEGNGNMLEQVVSGREMEYLGASWCEWKENGIFASGMERVEGKWNIWERDGLSGRK